MLAGKVRIVKGMIPNQDKIDETRHGSKNNKSCGVQHEEWRLPCERSFPDRPLVWSLLQLWPAALSAEFPLQPVKVHVIDRSDVKGHDLGKQ